jgi:hypothetical protein
MLSSRYVEISASGIGVSLTFTLDGHPRFFDEVDNTVISRWEEVGLPVQQRYLIQVAAAVDRTLLRPDYVVVVQAGGWYYDCSPYGCDSANLTYLGLRLLGHNATWYGATPSSASALSTPAAQGWPVPAMAFGTAAPLTVRILDPIDGDSVGRAVPISGTRTGTQSSNQHLWIFVHPEDGSSNWWAHPDEVNANTGEWQVTINFNGPPAGMRSDVRVGVIGEDSQRTLLRHLRFAPTDPLDAGLPVDFHELARMSMTKE